MAKKFLTSLNLSQNQLQNAVIHSLSTAPSTGSSVEGQIYYDTVLSVLRYFDGEAWITLAQGGDLASAISAAIDELTTDDIEEGANNVYFTDTRAVDAVAADLGDGIEYESGAFNVKVGTGLVIGGGTGNEIVLDTTYTDGLYDATGTAQGIVNALDTDDIEEGSTNLYFSDARARTAIDAGDNTITYNSSTGDIAVNTSVIATVEYVDGEITSAEQAASDANNTLSNTLTTAYQLADTNLSNTLTTAYQLADTALETSLTQDFTDADEALAETLRGEIAAASQGLDVKESVRVATTEAISLSEGSVNVISSYSLQYFSYIQGAGPGRIDFGNNDDEGNFPTYAVNDLIVIRGATPTIYDPVTETEGPGTSNLDNVVLRVTAFNSPTSFFAVPHMPTTAQQAAFDYIEGIAALGAANFTTTPVVIDKVALSGPVSSTIDGVTLVSGDRVLIKNQSQAAKNGIYVYTDVDGVASFERAADAGDGQLSPGTFTFVEEGSVNADSGFVISTDGNIVVGTTNITWTQFSGTGQIVAGDGIVKTGSTLSVDAGSGITVDGSGVSISEDYSGQESITTVGTITTGTWNGSTIDVAHGGTGATTLTGYVVGNGTDPLSTVSSIPGSDINGDISGNAVNVTGVVAIANGGTGANTVAGARSALGATTKYTENNTTLNPTTNTITWTVSHNLNTSDVTVQMRDLQDNALVEADVVLTNANTVTISWYSAATVSADAYRVVVVG